MLHFMLDLFCKLKHKEYYRLPTLNHLLHLYCDEKLDAYLCKYPPKIPSQIYHTAQSAQQLISEKF